MAYTLTHEQKVSVIAALAEGSSIRAVERMTNIHRDTIMRLGIKIGQGCMKILDETMTDLPCDRLELDDIWGYVGKKQRHLTEADDEAKTGDAWTFCAIDAKTKLVPPSRLESAMQRLPTCLLRIWPDGWRSGFKSPQMASRHTRKP